MAKRVALRDRIASSIAASREDAFLTREFRDLGCERHVLRALGQLVEEGQLIRLGYGVYGRAIRSASSGETTLTAAGGFSGASRQALDKLGIRWEETAHPFTPGRGPSGDRASPATVRILNSRVRRKLHLQENELVMERAR